MSIRLTDFCFNRRDKTMNMFSIMIRNRIKNKDEDGDKEEEKKEVKKKKDKSLVVHFY